MYAIELILKKILFLIFWYIIQSIYSIYENEILSVFSKVEFNLSIDIRLKSSYILWLVFLKTPYSCVITFLLALKDSPLY